VASTEQRNDEPGDGGVLANHGFADLGSEFDERLVRSFAVSSRELAR
jgi:hypothetical protein